jgi:hypothetical protein
MTSVRPGGNRRIDRVLDEQYLAGLTELALADVRALRDEADQEETDLSYLRRLLHGRMDLVTAELARRAGGSEDKLVDELPRILADAPRQSPRGLGRHLTHEPTNTGSTRRRAEAIANADVTDLAGHDEPALRALLAELRAEEAEVSGLRKRVQGVYDAASAEITQRYREGRAQVQDLLQEG